MMRHGEHSRRKADKPRVLWHPEAPPEVRQPPSLPELSQRGTTEDGSAAQPSGNKKQRRPSPKRIAVTRFKEPQPSEQELEIQRAFEAKAVWRTETWNRASLDGRLDVVKDMEVKRYAARPKTPEEPSWKGVVEPPPGNSALSKKMYEQIQGMVHIPEVERPVDMERPRGLPFHGEELRKIRERDRARRKAAAAQEAAEGAAAPAHGASPVSARGGRASGSPTMRRRSSRTPVKKGRDALSPTAAPQTPKTPKTPTGTAEPPPSPTPSPASAKQRWAGARSKLKVAAVMGAQLKEKREETTKLAARSRWKTGGLLAKQKVEQQKQAAQGVHNKVMTGAMAWKKKAAQHKEQEEAEAAAAEQRAKNKAMFAAAVQGDADVVLMALREGAEVDARNAGGLTVTQLAVERGRGAVVRAIKSFQREQLETAVAELWANYSAHLEQEGQGIDKGETEESPKQNKSAKMLWKKAAELVDPNPIAAAAATAEEKKQESSKGAVAVLQERKSIQAALDRAAPILAQLESLENLLKTSAGRDIGHSSAFFWIPSCMLDCSF